VALSLGALALVIDLPVLLVGAAGVFAWLLGAQVAFTLAIGRFDDSLAVEQAFERSAVAVDESLLVTIIVEGDARGLDVTVRGRPSAGLDAEVDMSGTIEDPIIGSVSSPVAGTHSLHAPELVVRDASGLFVERLQWGPAPELTVEDRDPTRLHVGEGGDSIPVAFGEHNVETPGSGIVPAEIREYVPGEAISRIDWKATARLRTPHVREFESEADITTILIVDHRGDLDVGLEGETALDYLRAAAIGYLGVVRSIGDPVGCYGVADDAIHRLSPPSNAPRGYERLRRQLAALDPTEPSKRTRPTPPLSRRVVSLDRDTEFGSALGPFVETERTTAHEVDPLVSAVRAATTAQSGTLQVVLFTDDTDRAALRDAVTIGRRGDNHVFAFVAPRVFFESERMADLQRASESYREFEEFRQGLGAIDRVRAYEVAPRDRMEALLQMQRRPTH
jgi:uncharacterized protein (DUF58 family)